MKIRYFFILFLLFVLFDAFILEPNLTTVKNEKLYLQNWDKNLNGYKIAVVSDIHFGRPFSDLNRLNKIIPIINSQNPDLICLLGDFDGISVSSSGTNESEIIKTLKLLTARDGVFAVLGNHDYLPENKIRKIMTLSEIQLLENMEKSVNRNNSGFRIIGLKDLWHNRFIPENTVKFKNVPTIVLSHNPDVFPLMPDFVSLTLSGHTHGGEIYFPLIGAPFVPSKFGQKYRKGHIIENNKHLYVTGGIATLSGVRFFNPPEISMLTVYSK